MRKLAIYPLLILLSACAALGVPQADTFGKKVIAANALVESVVSTTDALLTSGKIGRDEAMDVARRATEARSGIELARQIHASDPTAAETRLQAITVALTALEAALRAKQ